jgi:hypothetical protein
MTNATATDLITNVLIEMDERIEAIELIVERCADTEPDAAAHARRLIEAIKAVAKQFSDKLPKQ